MGDSVSDTYEVIMIRPGARGVRVSTETAHEAAFDSATRTWQGLRTDRANRGTEILTVRTDQWGKVHVSGRLTV